MAVSGAGDGDAAPGGGAPPAGAAAGEVRRSGGGDGGVVLPLRRLTVPLPEMTDAPSRADRVPEALFTGVAAAAPVPPVMVNRRLGTFLPRVVL